MASEEELEIEEKPDSGDCAKVAAGGRAELRAEASLKGGEGIGCGVSGPKSENSAWGTPSPFLIKLRRELMYSMAAVKSF